MGPKSKDKCPYKRHAEEKADDRREGDVEMKAEIRVMQLPQAQDCWQTPEIGRSKEQIIPKIPHRESNSAEVWTSSLQSCEKIYFCRFKAPNKC